MKCELCGGEVTLCNMCGIKIEEIFWCYRNRNKNISEEGVGEVGHLCNTCHLSKWEKL